MTMPRLHHRHIPLAQARKDIVGAIHTAWEAHSLSDVELLTILSEYQTSLLNSIRHSEWHPDDEDGDNE